MAALFNFAQLYRLMQHLFKHNPHSSQPLIVESELIWHVEVASKHKVRYCGLRTPTAAAAATNRLPFLPAAAIEPPPLPLPWHLHTVNQQQFIF